MSATAFQRMRRELEVKNVSESQEQTTGLTNKDIKTMLDAKGIDYDKKANKETLLKLLKGAE